MNFDKRTSLRNDGSRDDEGKLEAVLEEWIESRCSEVSYDHLIKVLKELSLNKFAEKVKSFI